MTLSRSTFFTLWLLGPLAIFAGCMPLKQARVATMALTIQDVAKAASKQSDLGIIRQGTPAYLMLLDGLLEAYPENEELLVAACQAYGSYASSFLADDEQSTAETVYRKAKRYGFRALSVAGRVDFDKAAAGSLDEFTSTLQRFGKQDIPALFWTAGAWAGWISANISSVEAMADLPPIEALMKRILELDDSFHHGGPHLLMGVYLAAKPPIMGGDPLKAKQHFDRAFALGGTKLLSSKVLFAQYYARAVKDRALYVKTLQEVEQSSVGDIPELTLSNTIAKEKAKQLLSKTEEYFEVQP